MIPVTHIATVCSGDRELDGETNVYIVREPESWRLVISDRTAFRGRNPVYSRTEILLAGDYFERFTIGDFKFLLSANNVSGRLENKTLFEALPMLKDGEQTVPEIYYDVFRERNRDQWIRFGITDRISCGRKIAESMFRIEKMEKILDKLNLLMSEMEQPSPSDAMVKEYLRFQTQVKKLDKYYSCDDWKKDFEMDEQGEFPPYLKRGVLSEDAVYDALANNEEILERFKQ